MSNEEIGIRNAGLSDLRKKLPGIRTDAEKEDGGNAEFLGGVGKRGE